MGIRFTSAVALHLNSRLTFFFCLKNNYVVSSATEYSSAEYYVAYLARYWIRESEAKGILCICVVFVVLADENLGD